MDIKEAILQRHAVRNFSDKKIDDTTVSSLRSTMDIINKKSGLHFQLCTDEPEAFCASKPHYGSFVNCKNYIAVVAKPGSDEKCGYYGEQIVLLAQTLGLNSCWVVLTYKKGKAAYKCAPGEKLRCVIALGYGSTQGVPHKSKPMDALCKTDRDMPDWFKAGMASAMLAPTAMNQQKFLLTLSGNTVSAKPGTSIAGNTKLDLGIAKYHFEVGAGTENFTWA